MNRKILAGFLVVVLVGGGLAAVKVLQIKTLIGAAALFAPPPETIAAAVATEQQWPETIPAVGSVSAAQGVTVAPEVAGTIVKIAFESGATVQPGELLVQLGGGAGGAGAIERGAQPEITGKPHGLGGGN